MHYGLLFRRLDFFDADRRPLSPLGSKVGVPCHRQVPYLQFYLFVDGRLEIAIFIHLASHKGKLPCCDAEA